MYMVLVPGTVPYRYQVPGTWFGYIRLMRYYAVWNYLDTNSLSFNISKGKFVDDAD